MIRQMSLRLYIQFALMLMALELFVEARIKSRSSARLGKLIREMLVMAFSVASAKCFRN